MEDLVLSHWQMIALVFGGMAAGVINTLAGNGSAITLSLLIGFGLPASLANATNRIGAFTQASSAIVALQKSAAFRKILPDSWWFIPIALICSTLGSYLATDVPNDVFQLLIGIWMLGLLLLLVLRGKRIQQDGLVDRFTPNWKNAFIIAFIGLYAGFIQMGMGVVTLSLLTLFSKLNLSKSNMVKQIIVISMVTAPVIVFVLNDMVHWGMAICLAGGQSLGGFLASKYLLELPKAQKYIRYLLYIVLLAGAIINLTK